MRRLALALALACCALAAVASAQVVEDDFEVYTAGSVSCSDFTSTGPWDFCNEGGSAGASCDMSVVTSITGYGGAMPSGSKVLRMQADSSSNQTECTLRYEGSDNNSVPASSWFHAAIYVRSAGTSTTGATNRWMKFWYPCRDAFPCTLGGEGGNWIVGLGRNIYAPLDPDGDGTPSPSGWNAEDLTLEIRGNTSGTVDWDGTAALGQTSLAEWIKVDRWNTLTMHMDHTTAGACHYRAWVGEVGSTPTQVMDLQGGTVVEGQPFTCDFSDVGAVGHQYVSFLSTIPNNNSTGIVLDMYLDDAMVTSNNADLPAYAHHEGATVPDAPTIGTATAGNAQCVVTFTPPGDDGGATITSYTATSSPSSITGTAASSPITVTGLSNGTGYTFTIVATNSQGNSSASSASNSCTPVAATGAVRLRRK